MKKIIFSDYDGTLDTREKDIMKNIEVINKFREKGNLFVIATGRSYLDLKRKLNIYPIPFDYLIINHGGVILDKNEKVMNACTISKKIALEILDCIKSNKNIEKIILFDTMKDIKEVSNQLTKILVEMKNKEVANYLSEKINAQYKEYVKSYVIVTTKYCLVEIISIKTDKGKAIEKILELEHIDDNNNVYPIGDGVNDVEMIVKYNGYGMTKSDESVYKVTNKLCNTVAELIERIN